MLEVYRCYYKGFEYKSVECVDEKLENHRKVTVILLQVVRI